MTRAKYHAALGVPLAVLFSSALLLSGCSSSKPEGEPTEISEQNKDGGVSLDSPEIVLLQQAQRSYQSGMYSIARENFEALRTGYPIGAYAEYAEIKIADCRFAEGEYDTAAQGFEDFVKNHPVSQAVPYALYMSGRSHQLANRGVGRDPLSLEKAAKSYERLVREYPKSFYTIAAAEYQKEVMEKIAEHEEEIIAFYQKRDKEGAAAARKSAYASVLSPRVEEARKAAEEESGEKNEQTPAADTLAQPAPPVPTIAPAPAVEASAGLQIQDVQCESPAAGKPGVFVHLNRQIPPDFEKEHGALQPVDGKIIFKIPGASGPEMNKVCPGTGELILKHDGTVELKTDKTARLISLRAPDRILILLDRD